MTSRVALVDARWSKKPPIPITAIAMILGFAIFAAAMLAIRAIEGEVLHIDAGPRRVRLIATDTHVLDFLTAFDALMKANPDALLVPLAMFS